MTSTKNNLIETLATLTMAGQLYLHFAHVAEEEGHEEIARIFQTIGAYKRALAIGTLDHLDEHPVTDKPLGTTEQNLHAVLAAEGANERIVMFAQQARQEGDDVVAEWLETVSNAGRGHHQRLREALTILEAG